VNPNVSIWSHPAQARRSLPDAKASDLIYVRFFICIHSSTTDELSISSTSSMEDQIKTDLIPMTQHPYRDQHPFNRLPALLPLHHQRIIEMKEVTPRDIYSIIERTIPFAFP
jgi:hypothetical protein